MSRYFLEVAYMGTGYAGFQVQQNAVTIQEELERGLETLFRQKIGLTGSSRTDAGVHARQNYFHFDFGGVISERTVYSLNALLPAGIAVKAVRQVSETAHCRFDALWREYTYLVYRSKDPFVRDRGYYFPYKIDVELLKQAAGIIKDHQEFSAFAKRNSQVKTFRCEIMASEWEQSDGGIIYRVRSNRFLRGMVRGLVGTMLQVGRQKISVGEFGRIIASGDQQRADFSVPGQGLCLERVMYGEGYFR